MPGSFKSCLTLLLCVFSSFPLPNNFQRVKLLLDLTFSSTNTVFSLARQAPILLSNEEPTLRSQVLSLKEYLYLGALMPSIWQLRLLINYIYIDQTALIIICSCRPMQFIKNREELEKEDSVCGFCFEVNYELLRCRGSCWKKFCKTCAKKLNYNHICPYCYETFKPEYLPLREVRFSCPSNNPKCEKELKSKRQFQLHCRDCTYLDAQIRQKYAYKTSYRCPKGHILIFPLNRSTCVECNGYNYTSKCQTCNTRHCSDCVRVPCSQKQCPIGHELTKTMDRGSITCDLCAIPPRQIQDSRIYSDRRCNFDVCQACWLKLPEQHPYPNYRNDRRIEEDEDSDID